MAQLKPRNRDELKLCAAVAMFADKMRQKLLEKSRQGYEGWDTCSVERLACMFADHLPKGDPIDLANFLMMLEYQGHGVTVSRVTKAMRLT